jgi:hypothetical protein
MANWYDNLQIIGNAGLFYVSYKLTILGWNVLVTSRNTAGPDILLFSRLARTKHTIQVKSSSDQRDCNIGQPKNFLMSDFAVICGNLKNKPEMYIAKTTDFELTPSAAGHYIKRKNYLQFRDNFIILGNPLTS